MDRHGQQHFKAGSVGEEYLHFLFKSQRDGGSGSMQGEIEMIC
jgi:hypothetical protein